MELPMKVDTLARHWWLVLLRGLAGIVFGIMTFARPGISLAVLVLLYGAYALADGVFALLAAIGRRGQEHWGGLVFYGLLGIAAGVVALVWPGITAFALLYIVAAWALITGVVEITVAVRLRKMITHEWLLALNGILSVALGIALMLFPATGALVLVLWIGAYAFVSGVMLTMLAFRLHAWGGGRDLPRVAHSPA
jgi:uncharacterized membrane protein HdeD (DUF308 family)